MKTYAEEEILNKLTDIETLLKIKDDKPLNSVETAEYLSISQSYLYKLTRKKQVPCHKPLGKYLYFFREELDKWIAGNN